MIAEPKKIEKTPKVHKEIIELEKKLAEKKQELREKEGIEKHEKEIIKEIIGEKIEQSKTAGFKPVGSASTQVLSKAREIEKESKERQIQLLVNLAFEKGIYRAVEVARNLDSPYLLDEFHDTLVDELYNKLVETGKLEKI
jgi:flagellar biosynthesis GTPase FlhF